MSANSSTASPLEALKAGFRRACVRRLVGDEPGAILVLKDEIPKLVVGWAKTSNLDPGEKKAKLKEMFDDESARADELATAFDLFAGRFETRLAEVMRGELSATVKRIESLLQQMPPISQPAGEAGFDPEPLTSYEKIKPVDKPEQKDEAKAVPIEEVGTGQDPEISPEQVELAMEMDQEEVVDEAKEKDLDPPRGIGLKFDEIEKMIDQVLSSGI